MPRQEFYKTKNLIGRDYFKALAEGAADAIKGLILSLTLGAGKKKTTTTSPKLPALAQGVEVEQEGRLRQRNLNRRRMLR